MKPKKHLGQNFLEDQGVIGKIVGALALRDGDTIVEIGPGHGELTRELLKFPVSVIVIEKDARLVDFLAKNFQFPISNFRSNSKSQFPKLEIINGDALKLLPSVVSSAEYRIQNTKYKLVGNIPYYITGHLLRVISELNRKPERIVLTVQKEVAERICAVPPKTNLLSASVQFWAAPETIGRIGREKFHPVPKVDSAIVRLVPLGKTLVEPDVFYPFIGALFKQPRKTIVNNLRPIMQNAAGKGDIERILAGLGLGSTARPQNLSVADIVNLARSLESA